MNLKSIKVSGQKLNILKNHLLVGLLDNSDELEPNRSTLELFNKEDLNYIEKYLSDSVNILDVGLIPETAIKEPKQYTLKSIPLPPAEPHDPYIFYANVIPHLPGGIVVDVDTVATVKKNYQILHDPYTKLGEEVAGTYTIPANCTDVEALKLFTDFVLAQEPNVWEFIEQKRHPENGNTIGNTYSQANRREAYYNGVRVDVYYQLYYEITGMGYGWWNSFSGGYYEDFSYEEPKADYTKFEVLYLQQ